MKQLVNLSSSSRLRVLDSVVRASQLAERGDARKCRRSSPNGSAASAASSRARSKRKGAINPDELAKTVGVTPATVISLALALHRAGAIKITELKAEPSRTGVNNGNLRLPPPALKIIVDADACPRGALAAAASLAEALRARRLVTVAGFDHVIDSPEHVTVGDGPQEGRHKNNQPHVRGRRRRNAGHRPRRRRPWQKKRRRFTRAASNTAKKQSPRRSKNAK